MHPKAGSGKKRQGKRPPPKTFLEYLVYHFTRRSPQAWLGRVIKLAAGWYISHILQSYTRGALWLPEEWREVITFICSLTFLAVVELMEILWEKNAGKEEKKTSKHITRKQAGFAILFLGIALIFVDCTKELRDSSVWPFSPAPDFWAHRADPVEGSTNQIPDIVNRERGTLYFPVDTKDAYFMHQLRTYAAYQSSQYGDTLNTNDVKACVVKIIDTDPDIILDKWALSDRGVLIRQRYDHLFMISHFFTVIFIGLAWGTFKKEEDFALEALINIFARKSD